MACTSSTGSSRRFAMAAATRAACCALSVKSVPQRMRQPLPVSAPADVRDDFGFMICSWFFLRSFHNEIMFVLARTLDGGCAGSRFARGPHRYLRCMIHPESSPSVATVFRCEPGVIRLIRGQARPSELNSYPQMDLARIPTLADRPSTHHPPPSGIHTFLAATSVL